MSDNYNRIICLVNTVYSNPKKNDFFMFNEGKQFIVDGKRLKLLPTKYNHLPQKDDFYLCIDPLAKKILYYAYDITYEVGDNEPTRVSEVEGEIPWDDLEDQIFAFFVSNSYHLTTSISPHGGSSTSNTASSNHQWTRPHTPHHAHHSEFSDYDHDFYDHGRSNQYNGEFSYGTEKYKQKEAFFDKVYGFVKSNQTSFATDFIKETVEQMEKDGKTDIVNHILGNITFDKLDIPVMLGLLEATQPNEANLRSRKDFFDKVQAHINKIKPNKAQAILQPLSQKPAIQKESN